MIRAHHRPAARRYARGITLVEILIGLGILVIILSFAVPSVGGAAARAEIMAAQENLEYSIEAARKAARRAESPVRLNFVRNPGAGSVRIKASYDRVTDAGHMPLGNDYTLPGDIGLVADSDHLVFDSRGLVDRPGSITLVSKLDDTLTSRVDIR